MKERPIIMGAESVKAVLEGRETQTRRAWNSFNAKRGYPWESNPWVWAVTFKVVQ